MCCLAAVFASKEKKGWARACSCYFQRLFPFLTFYQRVISTVGALGNNIKSWRTISNPLYEIRNNKEESELSNFNEKPPFSMYFSFVEINDIRLQTRSDVRQERGKYIHMYSLTHVTSA